MVCYFKKEKNKNGISFQKREIRKECVHWGILYNEYIFFFSSTKQKSHEKKIILDCNVMITIIMLIYFYS